MKIILYLSFFVLIAFASGVQWEKFIPRRGLPPFIGGPKPKNNFINSGIIKIPLDHFDPNNNRTWTMKYYLNGQFFKNEGPIFIMLGGEWTITTDWLQYGQMYEIAQQTGAYMFYTQHRFYGESLPDAENNLDLSIDNLKYLNSDQALADVAYFVKNLKSSPIFEKSKVVIFGGSYAGTLSFWMRVKYPDIIHGAVASSAPIIAKIDFKDYSNFVFEKLGTECSNVIDNAVIQILKHLGTWTGVLELQKHFNMCKPIDMSNILDVLYIFSHITTHFGNLVQNANCNSIKSTCDKLMKPQGVDDYTKLALYLNKTFSPDCLPNYQELKDHLTDLTANGRNTRQWFYQQCTEFGYFQTYKRKNHEIQPLEMYQTWCKEFFGSALTPDVTELGIKRTNLIYGDMFLNVTRVISVHGTGDPWYLLGVKKHLNSTFPIIVVNGSSHCQDLFPINDCDSEELINAKLSVKNYVKKWINEQ